MQEAWGQAILRKAARKLGYPQETLDASIARKMLAGKTLPKKARSTLLSFPTQIIWTSARLQRAGYDSDGKCQCGHQCGDLRHRLLQCSLSAQLRDAFTDDELDTISRVTDQAVAYGIQFQPEFETGAPD
eukprot:7015662-Pyramimonas_sp.AAC.1